MVALCTAEYMTAMTTLAKSCCCCRLNSFLLVCFLQSNISVTEAFATYKVSESVFRELVILGSKGLHQCFSSLGIQDSFFWQSHNLNIAQMIIFYFKCCKREIIHGRDLLCSDFHSQMPFQHWTLTRIIIDANSSVFVKLQLIGW